MTHNGLMEMFSDTQSTAHIAIVPMEILNLTIMSRKLDNWLLVEQFTIWNQHLPVFMDNNTILI